MLLGSRQVCYADGAIGSNQQIEAPTGEELDGQLKTDSFDAFRMLGKVILALIVVIGLFFVIIKYLSQKNKNMFGGPVRTLGGTALGQNKSLQIVEVGNSLYVLGVGENVQLLDKIEDAEEIAFILESMASGKKYSPSLSRLSGWLSRLANKPESPAQEEVRNETFHEMFQQKMKNVSGRKKMIEQLLLEDKTEERSNE